MSTKYKFAWFWGGVVFLFSLQTAGYGACYVSVGQASGFESSYRTARDFYKETPTGTVAYMPHVHSRADANYAYEFYVVGDGNSVYTIPCSGPYWFVVNHRGEIDELSQFIVVKIVYLYADSSSSGWLNLYRNAGWVDAATCDTSYRFYNPFSNNNYNSSATEFMRWHDDKEDGVSCLVKELDKIAGGKWHGKLEAGSDQDSLKLKYPLGMQEHEKDITYIKSLLKGVSTDNVSMAFRLLKFDVTQGYNSNRRLVFDVDRRGSTAILIKIFSPYGDKFSKKFVIKFR